MRTSPIPALLFPEDHDPHCILDSNYYQFEQWRPCDSCRICSDTLQTHHDFDIRHLVSDLRLRWEFSDRRIYVRCIMVTLFELSFFSGSIPNRSICQEHHTQYSGGYMCRKIMRRNLRYEDFETQNKFKKFWLRVTQPKDMFDVFAFYEVKRITEV